MFVCTFVVCATIYISIYIRTYEIWDCSSLLHTFRRLGMMSINETKALFGVKLQNEEWQRTLLHTLKEAEKHYRDITALHQYLSHQRVTKRTRQRNSLCCAKRLVSSTEPIEHCACSRWCYFTSQQGNNVTDPHCAVQATIIMATALKDRATSNYIQQTWSHCPLSQWCTEYVFNHYSHGSLFFGGQGVVLQ